MLSIYTTIYVNELYVNTKKFDTLIHTRYLNMST